MRLSPKAIRSADERSEELSRNAKGANARAVGVGLAVAELPRDFSMSA